MPDTRRGCVAVVGDNLSVSQAIEGVLRAAGYQTLSFISAEALLASDAANDAACLIVDIRLPGLSGFELRERLAEFSIPPPVIFITAYDAPQAREQGRKAGDSEYLVKPFTGRELLEKVRHAVLRKEASSVSPRIE